MTAVAFKIIVHEQEYTVTLDTELDHAVHGAAFKIETKCEYLFTIYATADEHWEIADTHVKPLNDDLIQEIGESIEQYMYTLQKNVQNISE